ncbi:MAG TPA: glycosyltransferase family A protein [Bacteroidales bacterium]|nr:glycosyltransferase family A protein [Bacteroidales bacterium]
MITRYIIITPARNEEKYIEKTIESVFLQTIKPIEWVIVNDGSTDKTGTIIDKYSKRDPWIKTVHRKDRGCRKAGGGVIEAFYDGYDAVKESDYEYIIKLDGDLSFDSDYFEKCFNEFNKDLKLGIGGGTVVHKKRGQFEVEKVPLFHVRGATKIYRRACWDDIGYLIKSPGWDTLDEVKANMLGWTTRSFPEIKVIHHRYTGQADGSWRNWVKNGTANYISGYHPLFMISKCVTRTFRKPYFIGSIGLFYGFIKGYIGSVPQINDPDLIRYIRKHQLRKLMFRKSIWN